MSKPYRNLQTTAKVLVPAFLLHFSLNISCQPSEGLSRGNTVKLANQIIVALNIATISETMVLDAKMPLGC